MPSLHHFSPAFQVSSEVSMRIIDNLGEMTETARGWLVNGLVGCVVIAGSVQARHEILVRAAHAHCETCVVCILRDYRSLASSDDSTYTSWAFQPDLHRLKSAGADVPRST